MQTHKAIAVLGTFDSKGAEHLFLKRRIENRGFAVIAINVGTLTRPSFVPDRDLFHEMQKEPRWVGAGRDKSLAAVADRAERLLRELYEKGEICGIVSAGGGTGTYVASRAMRALPFGVPKVMVSTVASRDMSSTVGTRDIMMIHSVVDIMGVNSLLARILDQAAGAVCAMAASAWETTEQKKRIALTMFGFITEAAERIKDLLEDMQYEVIPFHANGTGGMAMEELAAQGFFDGILDLATHELADELKQGYCSGIGPGRLNPDTGLRIPRLVTPGGLDCAVLEFTRDYIPEVYQDRKIFFYDFRSAIGLNLNETLLLANQLGSKLNSHPENIRVLIPMGGWSEADRNGGPLGDRKIREAFVRRLSETLDPRIPVETVETHINDPDFSRLAAETMHGMVQS
ncbi:MAG: Tm-1-like ATP-binding domain-containing protein, partial [Deltaproteobacteria bacterium]|nr:Tm-1-like ATP-binding domain-containing protein [Deltaproteobacteria bacterium]